jgi:predicted phosphodiesterase
MAAANRPVIRALALIAALLVGGCSPQQLPPTAVRKTALTVEELRPKPGELALPKKLGSVRLAVIGDSGRGDQFQNEVAQQMVAWRGKFDYDLVLMVGDNIYDRHTPEDYAAKFERPYKPLLDAGVTFQAAIGNHDDPAQIYYEKFNMRGQRYYTFRRNDQPLGKLAGGGVRFYALDSRSFDPEQLSWLQKGLEQTGSRWKIVYFHHPIYTSGRYQTGALTLRSVLEPYLVAGDADIVLSGHEHFYERILPQRGIIYFVNGAAGSLRRNDIRQTDLTARGFDTDYSFMLMEVSGSEVYFQAISRKGETVDAGVIRKAP